MTISNHGPSGAYPGRKEITMTYTITLTQEEMDMLINATNLAHLRYQRPEMNEAARKGAKRYGDLCAKLYYEQIKQMDAVIDRNDD